MKRVDRWSEMGPHDLAPGLVMLDPPSGCEVKIRRVEPQGEGVLVEYEPSTVGVGYFVAADRVIRTRKGGE